VDDDGKAVTMSQTVTLTRNRKPRAAKALVAPAESFVNFSTALHHDVALEAAGGQATDNTSPTLATRNVVVVGTQHPVMGPVTKSPIDPQVRTFAYAKPTVADHFQDDDKVKFAYQVHESAKSVHVDLSKTDKDGNATIEGLKSTWNADLGTPAHEPVVVNVTATDSGGEKLQRLQVFAVIVDGAPHVKGNGILRDVTIGIDQNIDSPAEILLNDYLGSAHFMDPEGMTLYYTAQSTDPSVITVEIEQGDDASGQEESAIVEVSARSVGTATVTVMASTVPRTNSGALERETNGSGASGDEGLGQKVYDTFEVTVVADRDD
jgi:hypothetical protein